MRKYQPQLQPQPEPQQQPQFQDQLQPEQPLQPYYHYPPQPQPQHKKLGLWIGLGAGALVLAILAFALLRSAPAPTVVPPTPTPTQQPSGQAQAAITVPQQAPPSGPVSAFDIEANPLLYDGKAAEIEMTINRVFVPESGKVAFLEESRRGFTLVIFQSDFQSFGGLEAIRGYLGQRVRVKCPKVELYEGSPECILSGPHQIQPVQ